MPKAAFGAAPNSCLYLMPYCTGKQRFSVDQLLPAPRGITMHLLFVLNQASRDMPLIVDRKEMRCDWALDRGTLVTRDAERAANAAVSYSLTCAHLQS